MLQLRLPLIQLLSKTLRDSRLSEVIEEAGEERSPERQTGQDRRCARSSNSNSSRRKDFRDNQPHSGRKGVAGPGHYLALSPPGAALDDSPPPYLSSGLPAASPQRPPAPHFLPVINVALDTGA
ncbi:hypothetical protein ACOMHN_025125 [Nucella lapillus]